MSQHHVIYVPGLADSNPRIQEKIIKRWRRRDVIPHIHAMHWADGELFEPKFKRLLQQIDDLAKTGSVSLVGASAGASAILNAFAERKDKIHKVVSICGKILNLDKIGPAYYKVNPAFKGSVAMLPMSLNKLRQAELDRVLCLYPIFDETVPIEDAKLPGSVLKKIPMVGHLLSIGHAITFGRSRIIRFIKS